MSSILKHVQKSINDVPSKAKKVKPFIRHRLQLARDTP